MSRSRRVVVTGMGAVTPLGTSVDEFWTRLVAGESGVRTIASFDASRVPCRIAGEVLDVDPSTVLDRKEIEKLENEANETTHSHKSRDTAKKPAIANQAVEGKVDAEAELTQEKDGADDAAKDLKEASLEDKETS